MKEGSAISTSTCTSRSRGFRLGARGGAEKFEIRNPKSEGNPKSEIRNCALRTVAGGRIRDTPAESLFGFRTSDFGFRTSDFPLRAFTFIEVLLATAIFAIVLLAINTVFYSALRLRQRTAETLSESLPVQQALAIMRRDLRGTLPPVGILASSFKDGLVGSGTVQSSGLEFFTTTGTITDDAPWGAVQKVTYQLTEARDRNRARGKDLLRSVTRNLLNTGLEEVDEQRLAGNIASMEFWCYNGDDWRADWDTTVNDTNLPVAVKVRLFLATEDPGSVLSRQPLELLVPLTIQARTNQTVSTGGEQ